MPALNRLKLTGMRWAINLLVFEVLWNQSYLTQFTSLQFVAISYRDSSLKGQTILIAFQHQSWSTVHFNKMCSNLVSLNRALN